MDAKRLSVSRLGEYIKNMFDDELLLHGIILRGEIGRISIREGASYFSLTEGGCYIDCVIFSTIEKFEVGAEVDVFGRVSYFKKGGKVSFTAKSIKKVGQGDKKAKFEQTKAQLLKEGLFENRPQPPIYIARAAIVTSAAGAVIHDIMRVISDAGALIEVKLYPAAVQGEGAAAELAAAIERANSDCPDVIIIARGGGSDQDLDAFNDEKLARTIAFSAVPVISAVGHETDYTLCDYCAGKRAGTPSIAAAMIAGINAEFFARIFKSLQTITMATDGLVEKVASRTFLSALGIIHDMDGIISRSKWIADGLVGRLDYALSKIVSDYSARLCGACDRMDGAAEETLKKTENRFSSALKLIESVNPLRELSRGYAKASNKNGAVNGVKDIAVGEDLKLYFADGVVDATVKSLRSAVG